MSPRSLSASRAGAAYRGVAQLSDTVLLVWSIGTALQQVEGALCLAIDPFWPELPKAWKTRARRNKNIDVLEELSQRLRELAEMVERVAPPRD